MGEDLRGRVEEDRGLLKRIQVHIPGFSGYRRREDLRQADSVLRIRLADRLRSIRERAESLRQTLVDSYQMKALEPLGRLIFECQDLEGRIRHAEQGYTGISWALRIDTHELNLLYEEDLALLEGLENLRERVEAITPENAVEGVRGCESVLKSLMQRFDRRMAVITGTEVV